MQAPTKINQIFSGLQSKKNDFTWKLGSKEQPRQKQGRKSLDKDMY